MSFALFEVPCVVEVRLELVLGSAILAVVIQA